MIVFCFGSATTALSTVRIGRRPSSCCGDGRLATRREKMVNTNELVQQIARRRQREDSCGNDVLTSYEVELALSLGLSIYLVARLVCTSSRLQYCVARTQSRDPVPRGSSHPCTRYCPAMLYSPLFVVCFCLLFVFVCCLIPNCPSLFVVSTLRNAAPFPGLQLSYLYCPTGSLGRWYSAGAGDVC